MTYEEFCSELLQKLENRKDELGYVKVKYYPDGFTSEDQEELMTIRDTNIRYNKTESDVLSGDFVILHVEAVSAHICRFTCRGLYRSFEENGWEGVWTDINSSLAEGKKMAKMDIMELIDRNEYEALKEKIFIRPLNYTDHRYELKNYVYRQIGDIVLVLYLLASDERIGERHDVSSMKLPRVMMETWNLTEDEVWENAMSSTYMMSPPRMYLNPMDTYKPPYHKGAFMAFNTDVKPLSARVVPTVTTTTQMNGAIAMIYPGVRERIAELFGGDYYVAFTSIHEARLHKKGTISPREILGRIKEMNRMLDSWEVLTRKVYLYEAASKEFKQLEL